MRQRAKARKIPFTITLDQFKDFCRRTGYLALRGKDPTSATVDRIDHDEGYHIWNIQVLSHAQNSRNGHLVPGKESAQNQSQAHYPEYEPDYTPPQDPNVPF